MSKKQQQEKYTAAISSVMPKPEPLSSGGAVNDLEDNLEGTQEGYDANDDNDANDDDFIPAA